MLVFFKINSSNWRFFGNIIKKGIFIMKVSLIRFIYKDCK